MSHKLNTVFLLLGETEFRAALDERLNTGWNLHSWNVIPNGAGYRYAAVFTKPAITTGQTGTYSDEHEGPVYNENPFPHSRACGWKPHDHGPNCHSNCPTCEGMEFW